MKVKDVMHKGVDWVSPDTPVSELAKLMREHDIGAIPIGEKGGKKLDDFLMDKSARKGRRKRRSKR
jgi:CBS domain-containing protein